MKKYNLPSSSDIGLNEMEKRSENSDYIATEAAYDASYTYTIEDDYVQSDEERVLVRKLDILIMPIVCVLVFMQVIGRKDSQYTQKNTKLYNMLINACIRSFSTNQLSAMPHYSASKKISIYKEANTAF